MQSTILTLQHQLKDCKQQLTQSQEKLLVYEDKLKTSEGLLAEMRQQNSPVSLKSEEQEELYGYPQMSILSRVYHQSSITRRNGRISRNCFVWSRYQRAQRNHNDDENEKINETKTLKVQHICDRRHFDFVRNTNTEAQPLEYTVPARVPVKKCTNSRLGYEFVQSIFNLVLLCVLN